VPDRGPKLRADAVSEATRAEPALASSASPERFLQTRLVHDEVWALIGALSAIGSAILGIASGDLPFGRTAAWLLLGVGVVAATATVLRIARARGPGGRR